MLNFNVALESLLWWLSLKGVAAGLGARAPGVSR